MKAMNLKQQLSCSFFQKSSTFEFEEKKIDGLKAL